MFKEWRNVSYMRKYDMKYDLTSSQAKIIEFLMVGCTDNFLKSFTIKQQQQKEQIKISNDKKVSETIFIDLFKININRPD